ncbi:MAG: hypothetical protein RL705_1786, partial [Bacteroidota bacterium]
MRKNYTLKNNLNSAINGLKTLITKKQFLQRILTVTIIFFTGISLQAQTTFTSVQSGNFSDPATWGTVTAPTAIDHIVIASGTTVLLDDLITVSNATISGILEGGNNSPDFTVTGNLTV